MAPTVEGDTLIQQADSLATDSAAVVEISHLTHGIVLSREGAIGQPERHSESDAMSWIVGGLILIFVLTCLRYRKNSRYFVMLVHDIMETRERHNAFDDTVRETSFLMLLNLLWCASAAVLLYILAEHWLAGSFLTRWSAGAVSGIATCAGVTLAYTVLMTVAYYVVGNVFTDPSKTSMWVKGYLAAQGLDALVMFPLAIIVLAVPSSIAGLLIVAGIAFIATKIIFIYKGFRIFFTQTASWVLFLYYLCSLEIVPLVLAYAASAYLCSLL